MSIEYCLQRARELPYIRGQQRHFAAVFCKRGRLISESANSYTRTHPVMHKASRKLGMVKDYIHSEVAALLKDRHRKGIKLIVVRVNSKGKPCYSEPCPLCKEIIRSFSNIKSIEYTV